MFKIYDKKMNIKPFPKGVRPLDIFVSSIQKLHNQLLIEGRPGVITTSQTHQIRPIEITILLEAENKRDYRLLRNEVFSFFDDDFFYISEQYDPAKRYKVGVINSFIPNRYNQYIAEARIMLDVIDLPYAESICTTQGELSENLLWWPDRNYPEVALDDLLYNFDTNSFQVYNGGNVPIHPFFQDLKITIDNVIGSTNYFELKNVTNGTTFRINEKVLESQQIILEGPTITSNGLQYLRKTNKTFIELSPGWNDFTTSGATSQEISFDFRFYYK